MLNVPTHRSLQWCALLNFCSGFCVFLSLRVQGAPSTPCWTRTARRRHMAQRTCTLVVSIASLPSCVISWPHFPEIGLRLGSADSRSSSSSLPVRWVFWFRPAWLCSPEATLLVLGGSYDVIISCGKPVDVQQQVRKWINILGKPMVWLVSSREQNPLFKGKTTDYLPSIYRTSSEITGLMDQTPKFLFLSFVSFGFIFWVVQLPLFFYHLPLIIQPSFSLSLKTKRNYFGRIFL